MRPLESTLIKLLRSLDFYDDIGRTKIAIGVLPSDDSSTETYPLCCSCSIWPRFSIKSGLRSNHFSRRVWKRLHHIDQSASCKLCMAKDSAVLCSDGEVLRAQAGHAAGSCAADTAG